jgi:hypothetical protein
VSERIDPTWVAWAFERPPAPGLVEAGLERVRAHYSESAERPLVRSTWLGSHHGVATLGDPEPRCRWPCWTEAGGLVAAYAYVPTGWQRVVGSSAPAAAAPALAAALWQRPERAAEELDAPLVIAVAEPEADRLVVVNDRIGAGRLYEMPTAEGMVWSNRLGALPLFAGVRPEADERGWALLAAGGWFMSDSTAIRGTRKARPGVVIEIAGPQVDVRETGAIARLVAPGGDLAELTEAAGDQARDAAAAAAELFPARPRVDLSGGRDSRVSAAAVIAAGVRGRFWTSDMNPGEADVARELAAAAPLPMDHEVTLEGEEVKRTGVEIRERARNNHLLHDGMRHASKAKGNTKLPPVRGSAASLSGHGGELGHGFYYKSARQIAEIRAKGERGVVERLVRSCRRKHDAGRERVYDEARAGFERLLAEGREHGIAGVALLDWYYLMDRFAHRSGLAAHTQRVTVFSTPGFIGAAFALSPEQRCESLLHRELIARLVPEWAGVPFYRRERSALPPKKRERIWEGEDVASMEEMLRDEGPWAEMFDPRQTRRLWKQAREGGGHAHYEDVFERIAYRVAFEGHLSLLGERATLDPRPA